MTRIRRGTGALAVAGIFTVTMVAYFVAAAGLLDSRVEIAEGSHRRAAGS